MKLIHNAAQVEDVKLLCHVQHKCSSCSQLLRNFISMVIFVKCRC